MALSSRGYTPTIFLLISLILLQLSTGSPITPIRRHIAQDLPSLARRQDGGFFSVLGVAGVGGDSSYPRLEIRELEKNTDQWNLYLLSLRRLQNVAQSDKLSYYQVAGMHTFVDLASHHL
jgi:tyrosinase